MSEKNRFSKPVAFNKKNEEDQKILKHVSRRNFSGYVKKLILEDIKRKEQKKVVAENLEPVKEDVVEIVEEIKQPELAKESVKERLEKASAKIKKQSPGNPLPGPKNFINPSIKGK